MGAQNDYFFLNLIVEIPSLEMAASSHNAFESLHFLIVTAAAMLYN